MKSRYTVTVRDNEKNENVVELAVNGKLSYSFTRQHQIYHSIPGSDVISNLGAGVEVEIKAEGFIPFMGCDVESEGFTDDRGCDHEWMSYQGLLEESYCEFCKNCGIEK